MRMFRLPLVGGLVWLIFFVAGGYAQSQVELDFLQKINAYRASSAVCWSGRQLVSWPLGSTPKLRLSPALSQAAAQHNLAMIQTNCTDHTCPGEPQLVERVALAGYPSRWNFLSENIAGGFESADEVFAVWQASPGHNRNMLTCHAHAIGISRVYEPNSLAWWYWTTDFGDVVDVATQPAPHLPQDPTPLASALDANRDGVLGDEDITQAIALWVLGAVVPGTSQRVDDTQMLALVQLWVTGQRI